MNEFEVQVMTFKKDFVSPSGTEQLLNKHTNSTHGHIIKLVKVVCSYSVQYLHKMT